MHNKPPVSRRKIRIGALTNAKLMRLMLEGVYSQSELVEMSGLGTEAVGRYIRALLHEGAAHICAWDEDARGRQTIRIVKLGVGKNMKRPTMTEAERSKRYRDKKRALKMNQRMGGVYAQAQ